MKLLLKTIKVIKNILLAILVVLAIISISTFAQSKIAEDKMPGIGSYRFFSVISGSMSPTIKVYDMIIDKKTETAKLKKGDIITFKSENSIITHRILKINGNGSEFVTKGDADNVEDENTVKPENIISKYLFRLPYMGLIISKIKGPLGIILMWLVFIYAISTEYISRKLRKRRRRKNKLERRKEIYSDQ